MRIYPRCYSTLGRGEVESNNTGVLNCLANCRTAATTKEISHYFRNSRDLSIARVKGELSNPK
jgi:hypothetical protein